MFNADQEQSDTSSLPPRSPRRSQKDDHSKRWTGTGHCSTQPENHQHHVEKDDKVVLEVLTSAFQQAAELSTESASSNFVAGLNRLHEISKKISLPVRENTLSMSGGNKNDERYESRNNQQTKRLTSTSSFDRCSQYDFHMHGEVLKPSEAPCKETPTGYDIPGVVEHEKESKDGGLEGSVGSQEQDFFLQEHESESFSSRPQRFVKTLSPQVSVPYVSAGRGNDVSNNYSLQSCPDAAEAFRSSDNTRSNSTVVTGNATQNYDKSHQEFIDSHTFVTTQDISLLLDSVSSRNPKRSSRSNHTESKNDGQSSVYADQGNQDESWKSLPTFLPEGLSDVDNIPCTTNEFSTFSVVTNNTETIANDTSVEIDKSKPKRIKRRKKKSNKTSLSPSKNERERHDKVCKTPKENFKHLRRPYGKNRRKETKKLAIVDSASVERSENTPKKSKLWNLLTAMSKQTAFGNTSKDKKKAVKIESRKEAKRCAENSSSLQDSSFTYDSYISTTTNVSRRRSREEKDFQSIKSNAPESKNSNFISSATDCKSIDRKVPPIQSNKPVFAVKKDEPHHQIQDSNPDKVMLKENVNPVDEIGSKQIEQKLVQIDDGHLDGAGEQINRMAKQPEMTVGFIEDDYAPKLEKQREFSLKSFRSFPVDQVSSKTFGEMSELDVDEECEEKTKFKANTTGSPKLHFSSFRTERDSLGNKQSTNTENKLARKMKKKHPARKFGAWDAHKSANSESGPMGIISARLRQSEVKTIMDGQKDDSRSVTSAKKRVTKLPKAQVVKEVNQARDVTKKLRSLKLRGVTVSQTSKQTLEINFDGKQLGEKRDGTDWLDDVVLALLNKETKSKLTRKEVSNLTKNCSYAYRRRLTIDALKENCCVIVVPLLVLVLLLAVLFGFLFSTFVAPKEIDPAETFSPRSNAYLNAQSASRVPITGILHVLEIPKIKNLQKYAQDWQRSPENREAIRDILSDAIKELYEKAGLLMDQVMVTNMSLFANSNLIVISDRHSKKPAVIQYEIYPTRDQNEPLPLDDIMRRIEKSLRHSTDWQFDPNYFELSQGDITKKAVSLQSFLSKDVPPLDMYSSEGGYSWQTIYNMTCPKILTQLNVRVYPLNCRLNKVSPVNQTCKFFCPDGFTLLGDEYTVCLANGIWSGRQANCLKSCPALPFLQHGRIFPSSCIHTNSTTKVLSGTRCMHFCRENYQRFGTFYRKCTKEGKWSHLEPVCKKQCLKLRPPQFGKVFPLRCSLDNSVEGNVCIFFCDEGYGLQGVTSTTCDSNGRWSQNVPGCRSACPYLTPVANATIYPPRCGQSSAFEGLTCHYSCEDGYQLVGVPTRSCGGDKWSGSAPRCVRTCMPLPRLSHGRINPTSCTVKPQLALSTCGLACDNGFILKGNESLACSTDGFWNETQPVCIAKCPPLETNKNGFVNCSGNMEGSTCELHCLKFQQIKGALSVTCGKDGTWNEPLGICLNTCPKLGVPSHGYVKPTECSTGVSFVNDSCNFYCSKSYGIFGSLTKTCLSNGTWSGNHTECVYENQFFLILEEHNIHVCLTANDPDAPKPEKQYFAFCTGKAFDYWSVYQEHLIKNSGNGKCLGYDYPNEMAPLAFLNCNATDPKQIWDLSSDKALLKLSYYPYYICYGYTSAKEVVASSEKNCFSDWMLYNPDTKSKTTFFGALNDGKCPALKKLSKGKWLPDSCWKQSSTDGAACTFVCASGYSMLNHVTTATCNYGIWSGDIEPSCVQSCPAYNQYSLMNGNITPEYCFLTNYVQSGNTCSFSCEFTFTLVGEPITTCLADGQWSTPAPQCKKFCPPLSAPINGKVSATQLCKYPHASQEVGSICNVVCNDGYVVQGFANSKCLANGAWSVADIICVRACFKPKSPHMGNVVCSETRSLHAVGTTCDYKCYDNRFLSPDIRNTSCLENGAWSNNPPDCQKFCPGLTAVLHAQIEPAICAEPNASLSKDFKCRFLCDHNYTLEGERNLVCLSSGKWNRVPPVCKPGKNFLLVHETNTAPITCIAVLEYPYHNDYEVIALPFLKCNSSDSLHLWSADSIGRIKNVATGWCLTATTNPEEKMLQLEECDNSHENTQRWESVLKGQSIFLRLKLSNHYLQHKNGYAFVSKQYKTAVKISWKAYDLSNNHGSVFGMVYGKNAGTCPKLSLPFGTNVRHLACRVRVNVGTSCYITCDPGYQLRSGATSTILACGSHGVWRATDIYCKQRKCLPLPTLPAATFINNKTCTTRSFNAFSSSHCTYSCAFGYYLNLSFGATGSLYCLGQGQWSEPVPICMRYCIALSTPAHGNVYPSVACTTTNNASHGKICTFSCKRHFYLMGARYLRCDKGKWNGTEPKCLRLSGSGHCRGFRPISLNNARVGPSVCTNNIVPQNTVCRIRCSLGYSAVLIKDEEAVCQANSEWSSPLPVCKKMCSRLPAPLHSDLFPKVCNHGVVTEGQFCDVICHKGYALTTQGRRTCLNSGIWDVNLPSICKPKAQFMLQVSNECAYAPNGVNSWVYFQNCSAKDLSQWWEWLGLRKIRNVKTQTCLVPESLKSYSLVKLFDCNKIKYGWDCIFSGSSNEGLTYYNQYELAKANSPSPRNLFIVNHEDEDPEWLLKRDTHFHALTNESFASRPCLYRSSSRCPPLPPIANGRVEEHCKGEGKNVFVGTTCKYYCNSGYQLVGKAERQCQPSGEWSNSVIPQCRITCKPLRVPDFATVHPVQCKKKNVLEGSSCIFACDTGFTASGSSKRICKLDGTWSGLSTICHRSCPPIQLLPMLIVIPQTCTTSNQTMGSICSASCPVGYTLVGSAVSICEAHGSWTGSIFGCQRSCAPLKPLGNGKVLPVDCTKRGKYTGNTCMFSCDSNYGLVGSRLRTCSQDGLWTGTTTACLRKCPILSTPFHGLMNCRRKQPLAGDWCTFSCDPKYEIDLEYDTRVCTETGKWSGSELNCIEQNQFVLVQSAPNDDDQCLFATLDNKIGVATGDLCSIWEESSRWSWHNNHIQHSKSRLCLAGKIIESGSHLVLKRCNATDSQQIWSCNDLDRSWFIHLEFPILYPIYSPLSRNFVLLLTDQNIEVAIKKSFLVHRQTQWHAKTFSVERLPVCSVRKVENCKPLQVYSKTIVEPSSCLNEEMPIGSLCFFYCPASYTLNEPTTETECLPGGHWSFFDVMCVPACEPFSMNNSEALKVSPPSCSTNNLRPESFVCRFSCPPNLLLMGSPVLTCQRNMEWNYQAPTCAAYCPPVNLLKHGRVEPSDCTASRVKLIEGTSCHYECLQSELVFSGEKVRTCTSKGLWDKPEGRCVKPCPVLLPPEHGTVAPPRCSRIRSIAGDNCSFSCRFNATLDGVKTRTCLPNGTWTGKQSRCKVVCPKLEVPENAIIEPGMCLTDHNSPGQACFLGCSSKHESNGNKAAECLANGVWSTTMGKCNQRCARLVRPSNGEITPKSCLNGELTFGHECSFSCEHGYVLLGSMIRACLSTGEWSGIEAICVIACSPIGPGFNVEYTPSSCDDQLQVKGSVCKASCQKGMQTREGLISSTAVCDDNGYWKQSSIKSCYPICNKPVVANGEVACFQKTGKPTFVLTLSTVCKITCNEGFVAGGVSKSTCQSLAGNYNKPNWSPSLTTCDYDPDPMLIINRVGYEVVCLGVVYQRVVLVEWQQCKNNSRNTKWVWHSEFQIRNAANGFCMDASHFQSNAFVTTSPCNDSNVMQKWTCSDDEPYLVRLVNDALYIDATIKKINGVVLTREKLKFSKMYTYNPDSTDSYGTLCSRRSYKKKGKCCVLPSLPASATFAEDSCTSKHDIKVGTVCSVLCNVGLKITIICQANGLWEPKPKALCKNFCEPFTLLEPNALFVEDECASGSVTFGTVCTLICKQGFVLRGKVNSTKCVHGAMWSPLQEYKCVTSCPEISHVENGLLTPNKCLTGTCNLTCIPGYRVFGPRFKTCKNNGKWSGAQFSCVSDTQFSIVSSIRYKLHSLCLEGTRSSNVVKAKCAKTQKLQRWRWNSGYTIENIITKECLAVDTSRIRKFNTRNRISYAKNGSFISTYQSSIIPIQLVDDGEKNVVTKKCDAMDFTQRWDCGLKNAFLLHVVARNVYLEAGALFQSSLNVTNVTNSKEVQWLGQLNGRQTTVCANRRVGACTTVASLRNGAVEPSACSTIFVVPGTHCEYTCDTHYILAGRSTTTCLSSGEWSNPPPSCLGSYKCSRLRPRTHLLIEPVQCTNGLVFEGQVCKMQCRSGTTLRGAKQLVCLFDGTWNKVMPTCDVVCPAIPPPHAGSMFPEQCERGNVPSDFVCASKCSLNKTFVGAVNRICLPDGSWEGNNALCEQFCPPLQNLTEGDITPKRCIASKSASGDVCKMACNFGKALVGKALISCIGGKWSDAMPVCKPDHCNRIVFNRHTENIAYSGVINGALVSTSVAKITCKIGYQTPVSPRRVCLPNGEWSDNSETCTAIRCPVLNKLYRGNVSPQNCSESFYGLPVGMVCYFSCSIGYLLEGTTSKECLLSGLWSYPEVNLACVDTIPKLYPITFKILQYKQMNNGLTSSVCLQVSTNNKEILFSECNRDNFYQRWKWLGSSQLQNVGSQMCLRLKDAYSQREESVVKGYLLHPDTCILSENSQVQCGDLSSEASRYKILIGNTIIGASIVSEEGVNVVTWGGVWIDYTRTTAYDMKPPVNEERMPVCSFMCGGNFIAESGDLSSPNYPFDYPKNVHCEWVIKARTELKELILDLSYISFESFNHGFLKSDECIHDFLEVREEQFSETNILVRLCANHKPLRLSTYYGRLRIVFHSDGIKNDNSGKGWSAHWWSRSWPASQSHCGISDSNFPVNINSGISPLAAPWQVHVIYTERDICNGAIYSSQFVITSAHCIESFKDFNALSDEQKVLVIYGFQDQANYIERFQQKDFNQVKKIWLHPQYSRSLFENNIAIIMVKKKISFGTVIQPICLPSLKQANIAPLGFSNCWGVHWSRDVFLHKRSNWDFTHYSYLALLDGRECANILQRQATEKQRDDLICAREAEGADVKPALQPRPLIPNQLHDEGNILQCRWNGNWYLVGVSSFIVYDDSDQPVYTYTPVRSHEEWIDKTTINSLFLLRDENLNTFL